MKSSNAALRETRSSRPRSKSLGDNWLRNAEAESDEPDDADFAPHWIEPGRVEFREGPLDSLELVQPDGSVIRSVFAVQCLPAYAAG